MTENLKSYSWRAFGTSIQGAAHVRLSLVNQDDIEWYPKIPGNSGLPVIMAVSDGHGSAKCFRSGLGSQFATKSAKEVVKQVLSSGNFPSDLSKAKHLIEEGLPRDIVKNWQKVVDRHLKENPFTVEELTHLKDKEGVSSITKIEQNHYLAYGATLLVTFVTETYLAILQLGDGDVLLVSDSGDVSRTVPSDERLIANETTSLSDKLAWQDFRTSFISVSSQPPAMILMSTDGYSNSFRDEESFLKIGADYLEMLRQDPPKSIQRGMRGWLTEASQFGSGDDITLGIIYRMDAVLSVKAISANSPQE